MMVIVAVTTGAALYVARNRIAADEERGLEREFQAALATLHHIQELRHTALVERCRALARKPRIHAALEDGALDLLYLSARDELRDALAPAGESDPEPAAYSLHAQFYRFLDGNGRVLTPPTSEDISGTLSPGEESRLAIPRLSDRPQTGYLAREADKNAFSEIIATPIASTETGEPIAALVLGFEPVQLTTERSTLSGFASGVWLGDRVSLPGRAPATQAVLLTSLQNNVRLPGKESTSGRIRMQLDDSPHLLFYKQLNPQSSFPSAFEICLFPLAEMQARQRRATWQILGAGAVLLLGGYGASAFLSRRFAAPVAKLAIDSREQRTQRQRAEAALETTSAELERVARFSADASHQLKTPVTVMRAGLEEMLARGEIPPHEAEEVSALIHQTYRLSSVIESLLLLSRVDAGLLKINFGTVDLRLLIEGSLDDLSAMPDDMELGVESDLQGHLSVVGERRYIALILQNLLENARKYNRPGGRIRLAAHESAGTVSLTVGNTTRRPIPRESQAHIFERFHRASVGENIPGYGIGLNLARELARLHDGDLRLLRSDEDWTEFEVRFRSHAVGGGTTP